jgi:multisubunit Na+/H+ antiporter MnhE subunit
MDRTALRMVRWWAVGAAGWLELSATLGAADVATAAGAGVVVAAVAALQDRTGLVTFRLRARWLVHLPRLGAQVLRDLVTLARALARPGQVHSAFRSVPLPLGGDDPLDVGRRGLLGLAASLGPNTFVVGFDREHDAVVVHQLEVQEQVLPIPDGRFPPP